MGLSPQQTDSVKSRIVYRILPDTLQGVISLPGVRRDYVENGIPIEEYRLLLFPGFADTHGRVQFEYYGRRYDLVIHQFSCSADLGPLEPLAPVRQRVETWFLNTLNVSLDFKADIPINRYHALKEKLKLSFKCKEVVTKIQRIYLFDTFKGLIDE